MVNVVRRHLCLRAGLMFIPVGLTTINLLYAGPARPQDLPGSASLAIGGGRITVQLAPEIAPDLREEVMAWVKRSAEAVSGYFGRFPVPEVLLVIAQTDGTGVGGGVSYGGDSPRIRVRVGRNSTRANFLRDWVMTHEMIHLAIPDLPRNQVWLHEGIATYVEGIARSRAGLIAPARVWAEWMEGMPQGLPKTGDRGLDYTPTWGRTYWGGALFCLLADIEIRRRSQLKFGLEHALRGLLASGGDYRVDWDAQRILSTADSAVRQTTLTAQYERMKATPSPVDLPALWTQIGVTQDGLRDDAPLAAVRRAIMS